MIEVNLLPPEYRPRDKTNLPLVVSLVVGLALVGGIIWYNMQLASEVNRLQSKREKLVADRNEYREIAKEVDELQKEIDRQKTRQQTIIDISQSKIMWSLKLVQFSDIMKRFPGFWIGNLNLTRGKGTKPGVVSMNVYAMGSDLREVARFRDAIKHDPNFYYHFSGLESDTVRIDELSDYQNADEQMTFSVKLPVQTGVSDDGGNRKRRRRGRR